MKIKGNRLSSPKPIPVRIFRGTEVIEFICGPVLDQSEFEALCPEPKPPMIMHVGGRNELDEKDKDYLAKVAKRNSLRPAFLFLKSLSFTPELEWETVVWTNPDTWPNYESELLENMTQFEFGEIVDGVSRANFPKHQEAIDVFPPASQEEALPTSQTEEPTNSKSGEPV